MLLWNRIYLFEDLKFDLSINHFVCVCVFFFNVVDCVTWKSKSLIPCFGSLRVCLGVRRRRPKIKEEERRERRGWLINKFPSPCLEEFSLPKFPKLEELKNIKEQEFWKVLKILHYLSLLINSSQTRKLFQTKPSLPFHYPLSKHTLNFCHKQILQLHFKKKKSQGYSPIED